MIIVAYECLFCYLNFSTNAVSLKRIIERSEEMEQAVHGEHHFIIKSMLNLMPIRSFSIMMNIISVILETFLISMAHLGFSYFICRTLILLSMSLLSKLII